MLYPAQLYKEELKKKLISKWYDPKYQWYFGGERYANDVPDNTEWRQDFVHLNSNCDIDGYFSYHHDRAAKSLNQFGLISFSDNGTDLVMDAIHRVKYMFREEGIERCEFWAFDDNPVNKLYEKIVERYRGRCVGYLTRCAFFSGKYHDMRIYEVFSDRITQY
jgi:hypothetical protein